MTGTDWTLELILEWERKLGVPPRPVPPMADVLWHREGPRIFDRVRIHPSPYWHGILRDELRGSCLAWRGTVGIAVTQHHVGPYVAISVDKPPRHRHRRFQGRAMSCWHWWHPDELELLALRKPGEVDLLMLPAPFAQPRARLTLVK